jgi:phosphoglycerate dehydrogenase-like enzyme
VQVLVPRHVQREVQAALQARAPSVVVLSLESDRPPPCNDAEILFRYFPNSLYPGRVFDAKALRQVVEASPKLRWIHNGMTGMDNVLYPELVRSDVVVTNGSGAHRHALAETVAGMMLAWAKHFREHLSEQQQHRWQHRQHGTLREKTVLIVGLGSVGETIARLCHCFGMRVIGLKRHPAGELPVGVDQLAGPAQLHEVLPGTDYVVIAAVLTEETRGMIGERELRLMPASAYLINIARGPIVDEQALIRALQKKWIAGASLDVFEEEPLPETSPLWALPNVLVTPHNAAWSEHVQAEVLGIFYENFQRFVEGRPLLNIVDKRAGY